MYRGNCGAFGKEVKEPMSLNEILASGGALLLFLTLVQITPIKVNPWSAVGKIIGNGMRVIGEQLSSKIVSSISVSLMKLFPFWVSPSMLVPSASVILNVFETAYKRTGTR